MTWPTSTTDGIPWWAELATPDLDRAAAFYTAVLGWTLIDDGDGLLARRDDHEIARLRGSGNTGAVWSLYFAVDDADDTCERLTELGGSMLHDPEEVGVARLFLALDPGGAEFGGREVREGGGPGGVTGPGALVGADAASGEPGQSRTFYRRLFGLGFETAEHGAVIVHPVAGPVGTLDIAGDALPHWRPRFGVADLDAARAAVTAAGGTVAGGGMIESSAAAAIVHDDAGAPIVLVETPPP